MTILKLAAALMLCGIAATGVHAAGEDVAPPRIEQAELQRQMEAAAGRYQRLATSNIISNRANDEPRWPQEFTDEQSKLLVELKKWSAHPEHLRAMIRHRDPKVRTLALAALFIREDPQELPVIASLIDDIAPTFTHVAMSYNSSPMIANVAEFQHPQTVGNVAQAMLLCYTLAAHLDRGIAFAQYWQERQARKTCASWLLVKVNRATRSTSPLQKHYRDDVEAVIREVKALPLVDRAWTQIFIRCFSYPSPQEMLTDAECIASLKEIGPDQVVQFLQQKHVSDDPDLRFDDPKSENEEVHSRMAHFILQRGTSVLRPQDAPALLACEPRRTIVHGPSPYWAAAAAEVTGDTNPAEAQRIIEGALQRFPLNDILGGRHQAVLIGSLWKIRGANQKQKIVDWFYRAQEKVIAERSDESNHGPLDFLRLIREDARDDIPELMAALVTAPGFDQTDWAVLKELLEIASAELPEPLVTQQMVYKAYPPSRNPKRQELMAEWRQLLIRHYQKPE